MANVALGGKAGVAGNGADVDVDSDGVIETQGDFSHGILAQSVGGGGGAAGNTTEQTLGLSLNPLPSIGIAADLSVGGFAYTGGSSIPNNGGSVIVHNSGAIVTEGAFANGILAQSVGGGGGTGGDSTKMTTDLSADLVGGLLAPTTASWDISVGGLGGKGGAGGGVTVDSSAGITTVGHFANGILAQSIGGGGGAGGERTKIATELSGVPSLGLLSVIDPSITLAVGGFGSNGGAGGGVDVSNSGAITTAGHFANGIHAQSVGGGGNGNITINNNGGIVQGGSAGDLADGSDAGAGVNIDGGANNTLTNAAGGNISALSGKAIVGGSGNETIHNYGTVAGTVELGGGANAFHNYSGARFDSGLTIDLGAGGTLTNSGILSPGGLGSIANTTLTGDFVQLGSGILEIEIDGFTTGFFDSLNITGTLTSSAEATGLMSATSLLPAGGDVHFSFLPGYDIFADIDPGESLALLFLSVEDNPEFLSTSLFSYEFFGGPAGFQFDVFQQGGGLYVQAENVVSLPGACLLGFLGLGVAGWKLRKTCA